MQTTTNLSGPHDFDALARDLVREWRGKRTQLELALELGVTSGTVSHWEAGRRSCRASTAFEMAELAHSGTLESLAQQARGPFDQRYRLDTPMGVAQFLGSTLGHRTASDVAETIGVSRHVVGRWLRGDAEPSLPCFLKFLDATVALTWTLRTLAPDLPFNRLLPGADPTRPVSADIALVSLALGLTTYAALPRHDVAWLAEQCHLDPHRVERTLMRLQEMEAIHWDGSHWRIQPSTQVMRGHLVRRPEPLAYQTLKAELAEITTDLDPQWESTTMCVVTRHQLRRVMSVLNHARSQIDDLLRENTTEGALVVLRMDATPLVPLPPKPDSATP